MESYGLWPGKQPVEYILLEPKFKEIRLARSGNSCEFQYVWWDETAFEPHAVHK